MPNQYTNGTVRCCDIVADYIGSNQKATARQIGEAPGMRTTRVSQELWLLQQEGRVISEPVEGSRGKARAWSLTDGEQALDAPRRVFSKTWTCTTKRHPQDVAFFGEARPCDPFAKYAA